MQAGRVSAGPIQRRYETCGHRIKHRCKYDWYGARRILQCSHGRTGGRDQNVRLERNKLRRIRTIAIRYAGGPADVDLYVASYLPATFAKFFLEI